MGLPYISANLTTILDTPDVVTSWLVEPFIPLEGIVFLYGKKSIGKSPLTWHLAQSVSEGTPFFGYPIQTPGNVLYVELDTPVDLVKPRWRRLANPRPTSIHLVGFHHLDTLAMDLQCRQYLEILQTNLDPRLVIVNTLRKAFHADGNASEIPSQIYGIWRRLFPHATVVFVHHDKKSQIVEGVEIAGGDEAFSGTLAWLNDAQIGLHLTSEGHKHKRRVKLEITGSQVGPMTEILHLQLNEDGTNFSCIGPERIKEVFATLDVNLPKMTRYETVAKKLGYSVSTVRNVLTAAGEAKTPEITIVKDPQIINNLVTPVKSST